MRVRSAPGGPADVAERGDAPFVERHVLVGVARRAVNGDAGNRLDLAVLVPRKHRHQVHLAALELVDARVGVGDEPEEDLLDLRDTRCRASSSARVRAGCTRRSSTRPRDTARCRAARGCSRSRGRCRAPASTCFGSSAADELQRVRARRSPCSGRPRSAGRACPPTRSGRSRRCSRGCRTGSLMASTVNFTSAEVSGVPSCHVDVRPQLPRRRPSRRRRASTTPPFSSVGTSDASSGTTFICVVGDGQPLDDAGLDVLEDVRAEAVERVGLAVVADDEQVVGRGRGRRRLARTRRRAPARRKTHVHAVSITTRLLASSACEMSGTGIAP